MNISLKLAPRALAELAGAGLLVFLAVGYCHRPSPAIPAGVQSQIDSLRITHRSDSLARAAAHDSIANATALAARLAAEARAARATASGAQRAADSLAGLAGAIPAVSTIATVDTAAERWKAAYVARTTEAVNLRATVAKLDSANAALTVANISLVADTVRISARAAGLQRLSAELAQVAERNPKILGLIPYPTRTQAAVGGAIVIEIVRAALTGKP